jgi:hypothetical protein
MDDQGGKAMLTVMEILSQPLFSGFRFLTDKSGLYNVISGVGIFEWESKEVIRSEFNPGEFVITTLSYARENIDAGIECLHALIGQKVALIAIKDIYFRELPDDLIQDANQNHIPILLFSGVNFEDIIFNVKNALLANNFNEGMVHRINNLFQTQHSPEMTLSLIKAINPFFRTQHICCLCRPISGDESEKTSQVDAYYKEYTHIRKGPLSPEQDAYTLVKYSFGILVIFSSNADLTELQKRLFALLQGLDLKRTDFRIGLSSPSDDLSQLPFSIQESIYACAVAEIKQKQIMEFNQSGIYTFLAPLRHHSWMEKFFHRIEHSLSQYDESHNSNLLETVLTYSKCNQNISQTADVLFQHSNTIRYRLEKTKTILKIDDALEYNIQMHLFSVLYEIRATLNTWSLSDLEFPGCE